MNFNAREGTVQIVEDQKTAMDVVREMASLPGREEPFYVVDLSDVVRKHKLWKMTLPRVEPFYAVKCNDTTTVLEVLAALGTGFDCASKTEIQKILSLGVDHSRIIYANPCKTVSFIKYAASHNVGLMTFDNEAELHKVKAVFPEAKLIIRIRVDGKARCPLGIKFGIEPQKARDLLKVAKALNLNVVGVSFHVGSGCEDANTYHHAIKAARGLFDFGTQLGYSFDILDIGGGFPGQKNVPVTFSETAAIINAALDDFFPVTCGTRIIAEPGRYYVASAFTLCANLIAKRVIQPENLGLEDPAYMYYINDGVYGSFNCLIFDHAEVKAVPLKEAKWQTISRCSVWGPTCDSMDCIIEECQLPNLDVGDWLVFEDMGAYTVAAASTFNGFQRPSLHFIASQSTWLYLHLQLGASSLDSAVGDEFPAMKTGIDVAVEDSFIESQTLAPEISVIDA